MGFISMKTHDNPSPSKTIFNDLKEAFVAEEWNSFYPLEKKPGYLHLKVFLSFECELYLKQPLTPTQCKIIVAYNTLNHRFAIETR